MSEEKWVKAFKGFNHDMTCGLDGENRIQYEGGKSYEKMDMQSYFYAHKTPLDTFGYVTPASLVVCYIVKLSGVNEEKCGNKEIRGTKIRIGTQLGIADLVKSQIEYVEKCCTNKNNADVGKPATAGDRGTVTAGDYGVATSGDRGISTSGYSGIATAKNNGTATAGDYGVATVGCYGVAAAGNRGVATAGDSGIAFVNDEGIATAGYGGVAITGNYGVATAGRLGAVTSGYHGTATSRGSVTVGAKGVGTVRGNNVKIRGGLGALLVAAEENQDSYDIDTWATAVVDGENIKPDTWYCVKNGKFVEAQENENWR